MDYAQIVAALENVGATAQLCAQADDVRAAVHGDQVHLRAIVEFSNVCRNDCVYCGIQRSNTHLRRYRLPWNEVLDAAQRAADEGFGTIILQSGEDPNLDIDGLADTVSEIKKRLGIAVTLSCGEWSREVYRRWRDAGADRYLLKLEIADPELYAKLHPQMSFTERRRCLDDLFALGYQVGSGNIVGLPGQTAQHLARDIEDFAAHPYDMVAVGPLIPARHTPLEGQNGPAGDLMLRVLALARLHAPQAHIPSTTALCALDPQLRRTALAAGANVVMINFTPNTVAGDYQIYRRAECGSTESCLDCIRRTLAEQGLRVAEGVGGGLRSRKG